MKFLRLLLLVAAFALPPPLPAEPPSALPPPRPAEAAPAKAAFLRAADVGEKTRGLQTASVEYHPASGTGPTVWLVGVAHLGTVEYYAALQKRLDAQTLVLYEGIGIHDVKQGPDAVGDAGIQTTLANALGLKFQLNAIDYRRPNWVNSDLHVPEIEAEVKERGAGKADKGDGTFDALLSALQGDGAGADAIGQVVGLLGSTPQLREMSKTMLIEVLGQAGELLGMARTLSPEIRDLFDVLLTQRNDVVLRDLRTQLAAAHPGDRIAVFYGAAHMDELARNLRDQLGYVPVKTEWDTAFSSDAAASGVDPAQLRMMLEMIRSQLPAVDKAPAGEP